MEAPQSEQWQQREGSRVEAKAGGEMADEAFIDGGDGGMSGPPSPIGNAAGNLITASAENRSNSPMIPANYVTASPCFRSPVAPPSPSLTLSPSPALLPSPAMPHTHSAPRAPSAIPPLPASLPTLPASVPRVTAGLPPLSAGPFSSPEPRTPPAVPRLRFQRNPRSLFGRGTGERAEGLGLLDLPQEVVVRIVCCLRHHELSSLLLTSKAVSDAVLTARAIHFDFTTPDVDRRGGSRNNHHSRGLRWRRGGGGRHRTLGGARALR
ncbi:unnamed protein product [Closterium sp. Yama58-4]|nr:unnamed protein product [Closterium sp. Yama58-4]